VGLALSCRISGISENRPLIVWVSSLELPDVLSDRYRLLEEEEKEDFMSYFSVYVAVEGN